jgi:hypothetical protein
MSPRHFRHSGQIRSQRRKLVWSTTDQNVSIPAGNYTNINLLAPLATAGSSLLGITIMRTIYRLAVTSVISNGDAMAVGLIVVKASEIGANVAGAASPAAGELDWLWLTKYYSTSGSAVSTLESDMEADTKAKRKMQELQQAYSLSILNSVGIAKTVQVWARTLVALP